MMMNHRVALLTRVAGRNAANERGETWTPGPELWANVKFQTGAEVLRAGADVSIVKCSIRIRQRSGVDASMRARYQGIDYNIKAVMPDSSDTDHMFLVCESV